MREPYGLEHVIAGFILVNVMCILKGGVTVTLAAFETLCLALYVGKSSLFSWFKHCNDCCAFFNRKSTISKALLCIQCRERKV